MTFQRDIVNHWHLKMWYQNYTTKWNKKYCD